MRNVLHRRRLRVWAYSLWLVAIAALAALHAIHLRADFPNHSPWFSDWAKYTDEGWWANAAVRAHLLGHWYLPGDYNPAVAVPVWPAVEWVAFAIAGVSLQTARGLAIICFFANLALMYLLVRSRAPRWAGLLAVTLAVSSPFLYAFSRLAILEPLLIALTLAALNLAVRLPRFRHPVWVSAGIGLLFALMMLTKTAAVFLAPAVAWAMAASLMPARRRPWRCIAIGAATAAGTYGLWLALIAHAGLMRDYRFLFLINQYDRPSVWTWPFLSLWWALHGALWIDALLIPVAAVLIILAIIHMVMRARQTWGRALVLDPAFGAAFWCAAGYVLFMTWQNNPQPRYYAVLAYFCFAMIALATAALMEAPTAESNFFASPRLLAGGVLALAALATAIGSARTIHYALHPQYTFTNAAAALTRYIDAHPNGHRLLVSASGDEIMLTTHLPALCDDWGTPDGTENLPGKLAEYQPGWYAAWNDLDPENLQDLHTRYSLEQVASFPAYDDPNRNVLLLFKLHPLPASTARKIDTSVSLKQSQPTGKIAVDTE